MGYVEYPWDVYHTDIMGKDNDLERMMGDPRLAIRSMILPFLIALVVAQVNAFIDTFWVSGLGIDAVSGLSSAYPLYTLFINVATGLSVAATATIAYRLGRGDDRIASKLAGNSLILGTVLSVLTSVLILVLLDPSIDLMGAGDVRSEIRSYVMPYILLSPLVVLNTVMGGLLRAEGSSKRSMIILVSSALFNMVLDPILIYHMGMGLFGAGLATCIGLGFGLAIGIYWYVRGRTVINISGGDLLLDATTDRELLSIAVPRAFEGIIFSVTTLVQRIFIIIAGGTVGVSLFNVPYRYVYIFICPSDAIGMAMVPVVAAAYGQGVRDKMKQGMLYATKLAILISLGLMVVLFVFSDPLISIFMTDESMMAFKTEFVWVTMMYSLILPTYTVHLLCSSMLQAIKRANRAMQVTMVTMVVRFTLFWIASNYDFQAIIYAALASFMISATMMYVMMRYEFSKLFRTLPQRDTQSS